MKLFNWCDLFFISLVMPHSCFLLLACLIESDCTSKLSQTLSMVSHKRKTGFIFILAYVCFLPPAHQAQLPNASVLDLSSKNIDFAMNLYGQISSYHDKNIFFSPLSIFTSFAALLLASGGNTHEEILKGLNLEQLDRADQPDLIPKLFQLLQEDITHNGSLKVDQDMALFVHKEFSIEKVFEDQIKSFFNADIKSLDFADTKASKTFINDYISNRTEDKVKEMISSVDALTQLMLINTIFFQGKLTHPLFTYLYSQMCFNLWPLAHTIRQTLLYQQETGRRSSTPIWRELNAFTLTTTMFCKYQWCL